MNLIQSFLSFDTEYPILSNHSRILIILTNLIILIRLVLIEKLGLNLIILIKLL